MYLDLEHRPFRRRNAQFNNLSCFLLASVFGVSVIGCGSSEPQEISAATSGYMPAKEKDSKASESKSKSDLSASEMSQNSSDGANPNMPVAPAVPTFQPGKLDPKIASKPYMTLQLGDLNGTKPLMEFLSKSSRAVMELVADGRKKLLTTDVLLERGMSLSRMKLEAAERLEKLAKTEDEKAASSLGRLEAYSQMTSFGDVASSDSLRELAVKEMENLDKRVAQQAKSISLSLMASDFNSGTAKSEELVELAKKILADSNDLTEPNLNALKQAIDALSKRSQGEEALNLAKVVEEQFRNNEEPQLALSAWELHATGLKETNELLTILQGDTKAAEDPKQARTIMDALMAKIPSPWTSFFLVQNSINVEYSGRLEIAKEMIEVAETQIENLKNPEAKEELVRSCRQFKSRFGTLNKPMNLSDLVDTTGKPIDLDRYKGKVVLVDFWATWCGPCLQEIPNIEEAYTAHNKNGFEVIGVNLDKERNELDEFMASHKLLWNTYVSSRPGEVGFDTPLAKEIGISAIPFIAIIGKDGNVAGIHVRGKKIQDKIVALLAKE